MAKSCATLSDRYARKAPTPQIQLQVEQPLVLCLTTTAANTARITTPAQQFPERVRLVSCLSLCLSICLWCHHSDKIEATLQQLV